MNVKIAQRLAELRRARGYSQESLARELGLSRQAVSKWERARCEGLCMNSLRIFPAGMAPCAVCGFCRFNFLFTGRLICRALFVHGRALSMCPHRPQAGFAKKRG